MNDIAAANLLKQLSGLSQKGYLTNIEQFLHLSHKSTIHKAEKFKNK